MRNRWYYVCDADKVEETRQSLPVAPGSPRYSNAGTRALLRLKAWAEGAKDAVEVARLMKHPGWARPDTEE